MRLIDADKLRLVKCGEQDSGKPINCVYEWAIKDAPTTDAIPIVWMEKWFRNDRMADPDTFIDMISDWKKENEKEK